MYPMVHGHKQAQHWLQIRYIIFIWEHSIGLGDPCSDNRCNTKGFISALSSYGLDMGCCKHLDICQANDSEPAELLDKFKTEMNFFKCVHYLIVAYRLYSLIEPGQHWCM